MADNDVTINVTGEAASALAELQKASAAFAEFQKQGGKGTDALNGLNKAAGTTKNALTSLGGIVKMLGGLLWKYLAPIMAAVESFIALDEILHKVQGIMADTGEATKYEKQLKAITGSTQQAKQIMTDFSRTALAINMPLDQVRAMGIHLDAMGANALSTTEGMTLISNSATRSGKSFDETANALAHFQIALSTGRNVPRAAQELVQLGIVGLDTAKKLKTMTQAGATDDAVGALILSDLNKIPNFVNNVKGSFSSLFQELANQGQIVSETFFVPILTALYDLDRPLVAEVQNFAMNLAPVVTEFAGFMSQKIVGALNMMKPYVEQLAAGLKIALKGVENGVKVVIALIEDGNIGAILKDELTLAFDAAVNIWYSKVIPTIQLVGKILYDVVNDGLVTPLKGWGMLLVNEILLAGEILSDIWTTAGSIIKDIINDNLILPVEGVGLLLKSAFEEAGANLLHIWKAPMEYVYNYMVNNANIFKNAVIESAQIFESIIGANITALYQLASAIPGFLGSGASAVGALLKNATTLSSSAGAEKAVIKSQKQLNSGPGGDEETALRIAAYKDAQAGLKNVNASDNTGGDVAKDLASGQQAINASIQSVQPAIAQGMKQLMAGANIAGDVAKDKAGYRDGAQTIDTTGTQKDIDDKLAQAKAEAAKMKTDASSPYAPSTSKNLNLFTTGSTEQNDEAKGDSLTTIGGGGGVSYNAQDGVVDQVKTSNDILRDIHQTVFSGLGNITSKTGTKIDSDSISKDVRTAWDEHGMTAITNYSKMQTYVGGNPNLTHSGLASNTGEGDKTPNFMPNADIAHLISTPAVPTSGTGQTALQALTTPQAGAGPATGADTAVLSTLQTIAGTVGQILGIMSQMKPGGVAVSARTF